MGLGRKALVHLIATEKAGSKGALWTLPFGDFVADTKTLADVLKLSGFAVYSGRGADHEYSEFIYLRGFGRKWH